MNIYVGNMPYNTSESDIKELFEQYGSVLSVKMINDRQTGRPRGFGFVEMEDEDGKNAIDSLNDTEVNGRKLQVNEARDRKQDFRRPPARQRF